MEINNKAALVVGLLLLAGSVAGSLKQILFIKKAKKTYGVIRSVDSTSISSSSSDGRSREMAVEFKCEKGIDYQFFTNITDVRKFHEGQKIPVLYDKKDPNKAFVDTILQMFFVEMVLGVIGISILFLSFE